LESVELLIARNPDPDSRLPYLLLLPLVGGIVFRTSGTWPRTNALVVVEDRYSQVFKLERVRPALVADGLAELQIRWPSVPVVFCETRQLAEEWTYRFLAAARAWADTETASIERLTPLAAPPATTELAQAPDAPEPSTAEVRAWARAAGLAIPGRGKLRPEIWAAWRAAQRG
jgi:hypothetical protein